jgi:hypothetical protein
MAGPIGLTADIKVDARPVTASIHGLMGAPARSQGEDGFICSGAHRIGLCLLRMS